MSALALISDLMTQSQAAGAAQRAGVGLSIVNSTGDLLDKVDPNVRLVVLDLSHPNLDVAGLMAQLKPRLGPKATVLAFGPHVHRERLAAAAEAGCQEVVSRGQFHAQAAEMLKRWAEHSLPLPPGEGRGEGQS